MTEQLPLSNIDQPARVVYVDLGRNLESIAEPGSCGFCHAPMQKEFLEYDATVNNLRVLSFQVPGYGCTGCGQKEWVDQVLTQFLGAAVGTLRSAGRLDVAARFDSEIQRLQRISA